MKTKLWLAPLFAAGIAAVPATAIAQPQHAEARQQEVRIPFANHGGIRSWRGGDHDTIYLQDRQRRWYEVTLMGSPTGLPWAWAIGFDTGPLNTFDRFSRVVVDGWRYPVQSIVPVEGPPQRRARSDRRS